MAKFVIKLQFRHPYHNDPLKHKSAALVSLEKHYNIQARAVLIRPDP